MQIQWYPGHMTKAKRQMQDDVKKVDLVIELLDARVPLSSRNPDIDKLASGKFRLVLLNKSDLSDPSVTALWIRYFQGKNITVIPLDSRKNVKKSVTDTILNVCQEKFEKEQRKGMLIRPVRAMVAGIPNVGKSTFINSMAGKGAAKTGNKPGVTKGSQWIRLNERIELLDTPGILWPKFDDERVGRNLALIGSINDQIIDKDELCYEFIKLLLKNEQKNVITERYGADVIDEDPLEVMNRIALARHALKKGGIPDISKASSLILDDYRSGKLGTISLERPKL